MNGVRYMEYVFDKIEDIKMRIDNSDSIALFLDYDGTLVRFRDRPKHATPPQEVIEIIEKLVGYPKLKIFIISGRTLSELKRMLPIKGLSFIGLHGLEMDYMGKSFLWEKAKEVKPIIAHIKREALKKFEKEKKVIVEDKTYALALHYRMLERDRVEEVKREFLKIIKRHNNGNLEILPGAEVLDLRPKGWDKGKAVSLILKKLPRSIPVYIGDDRTDEDAFRILKQGITILISDKIKKSYAKFYLRNPDEVIRFLKEVIDEKEP